MLRYYAYLSDRTWSRASAPIALMTLLLARVPVAAQVPTSGAVISGRVTQVGDSSIALAGVDIEIVGTGMHRFTNSAGRFAYTDVPAGDYEIRVRLVGYRPAILHLEVVAGRSYRQDFAIAPIPQTLAEVRIDGKLVKVPIRYEEVYKRASRGFGKFFTREDIEQLHPYEVKSLLNLIPTVQANDRGVTFQRCQANMPSPPGQITGGKSTAVRQSLAKVQGYIDGVRMTTYGGNDSLTLVNQVTDVLRYIHPNDIQIMEVYTGVARIPAEFLNDACAVIAIWTK